MNFLQVKEDIKNRIEDSMSSLWALGDIKRQKLFKELMSKERIISKPLFQNNFLWTQSQRSYQDLVDEKLFDQHFIDSINTEYPPYVHQIESWEWLLKGGNNPSVAVTTGTGSGKTECFMYPVLYDLYKYKQKDTSPSVNAIFLYPLNALIKSQINRLQPICNNLGVTFAQYTGDTETNNKINANARNQGYPELITREQIRETPPSILFTNTTMLEFMLVRSSDQSILQQSQGKLRWIVLDEAHVIKGSKATEMALLLKRVMDAFGTNSDQIRFAITSATVGENKQEDLQNFMSELFGIDAERIKIISGKRQFTIIEELSYQSIVNEINSEFGIAINSSQLRHLRHASLDRNILSIEEINTEILELFNEDLCIKVLDQLADHRLQFDNGRSEYFLPLRMHLFIRNILGVFACVNTNCTNTHTHEYNQIKGHTFERKDTCNCGSHLFELVTCRSCGEELFTAQRIRRNARFLLQNSSISSNQSFIDSSENREEEENESGTTTFYFYKRFPNHKYIDDVQSFSILADGTLDRSGNDFVFFEEDSENGEVKCRCIHCNDIVKNPHYYRLTSSFINRSLPDVILSHLPGGGENTFRGRYITFTDSRQKTAKITAMINKNAEDTFFRSRLIQIIKKSTNEGLNPELQALLDNLPEESREIFISTLANNQNNINFDTIINNFIENYRDELCYFITRNITDLNVTDQKLQAEVKKMIISEFAKRLPKAITLENLGIVNLKYKIDTQNYEPYIINGIAINKEEFVSLCHIAIDFYLRYRGTIDIPFDIRKKLNSIIFTSSIYKSNEGNVISEGELVRADKSYSEWPHINEIYHGRNRLINLVLAGINVTDLTELNEDIKSKVNDLLSLVYNKIRVYLKPIGNNTDAEIALKRLNLFHQNIQLVVRENQWICPVRKVYVNHHFKNISPWIAGYLNIENVNKYRIVDEVSKIPDFALSKDDDLSYQEKKVQFTTWRAENTRLLEKNGLYNNIVESALLPKPKFLAAEHSGQLSREKLHQVETNFNKGRLNILNCSTTMEMGVDISDISAVLNNNVPPQAANYFQRIGRAGRRFENKVLALTTCDANPIGLSVLDQPYRYVQQEIDTPKINFLSHSIVQKNINSLVFSKFVKFINTNDDEYRVTDKVGDFFIKRDNEHVSLAHSFSIWLNQQMYNDSLNNSIDNLVKNTSFNAIEKTIIYQNIVDQWDKVFNETIAVLEDFKEKLDSLDNENLTPRDYALSYQDEKFKKENLLTFLASMNFLPSSGLPISIIEFSLKNNDFYYQINNLRRQRKETSNRQLKKDLKSQIERLDKEYKSLSVDGINGLRQYAPGCEVVKEEQVWKSAGYLKTNDFGVESKRMFLYTCENCRTEICDIRSGLTVCTCCNEGKLKVGLDFEGKKIFQTIVPVGFSHDPSITVSRNFKDSNPLIILHSNLLETADWSDHSEGIFEMRSPTEEGKILFTTIGSQEEGYTVCLKCGRATENQYELNGRHRSLNKNFSNDEFCEGTDENYGIKNGVGFSALLNTNYTEIKIIENGINTQNEVLLNTLGSVFCTAFTMILGIEKEDINYGIKSYSSYKTLYIYDTINGGAGYSNLFSNYYTQIFEKALEYLDCSCNKACTKCLIDSNSQWKLDVLDRNVAMTWLNNALESISVPEYLYHLENIKPQILDISSLLALNKSTIDSIYCFVNSLEEIKELLSNNLLSTHFNQLKFVFREKVGILSNEQKDEYKRLKLYEQVFYQNEEVEEFKFEYVVTFKNSNVVKHLIIDNETNKKYIYGNS